jgi:hypothetical protein
MMVRYYLLCPGCGEAFTARIALGPAENTRFYLLFPHCTLPIEASATGRDLRSHQLDFECEVVTEDEVTEGSAVITVDLYAPSKYDADSEFFEFVKSIADSATIDGVVHLSPAGIRPMAGDDVATAVGRAAVGSPVGGVLEVAGPQRFGLDELVRIGLEFRGDPRGVVADPEARYFGALLADDTLLPGDDAQLATTRFEEWLPANPPPPAR